MYTEVNRHTGEITVLTYAELVDRLLTLKCVDPTKMKPAIDNLNAGGYHDGPHQWFREMKLEDYEQRERSKDAARAADPASPESHNDESAPAVEEDRCKPGDVEPIGEG